MTLEELEELEAEYRAVLQLKIEEGGFMSFGSKSVDEWTTTRVEVTPTGGLLIVVKPHPRMPHLIRTWIVVGRDGGHETFGQMAKEEVHARALEEMLRTLKIGN